MTLVWTAQGVFLLEHRQTDTYTDKLTDTNENHIHSMSIATSLGNNTRKKYSSKTKGQVWHSNTGITNHCFRRSGLERMVRTMRAPLIGGLEYIGRMRTVSYTHLTLPTNREV